MTLGDGKRKVLMLIDEYSSGGAVTVDEDINVRMADFFDIAQKQIAQVKRILRLYPVERGPEDGAPAGAGLRWYKMPPDFAGLRRVWRDGALAGGRYRWREDGILIPDSDAAAVEVEYFAIPATVGPGTKDDYVFEVAEDAAQCMPFFVAAQQLVADLVVDYAALLTLYNLMLTGLDTRLPGETAALRNTFYRGV